MGRSKRQFRSALGGYHKGDVTAYIEKTAAEHRSELLEREKTIADLQKENHALQQQLNLLMMSTPAAAPAPAPAPAPAKEAAVTGETASLELQAYRRAEAVERAANTRASKLYKQLEGMCVETMDEFRATDEAVKQVIEVMLQQANNLEQTYQSLCTALDHSREKLAAMNDLATGDEKAE